MTGTPAGPNSSPLPNPPLPVTIPSLSTWFAATQSSEGNSVRSSPRSKKGASSAKPTAPTAPSRLEAEFALQLRAHKIMGWVREFRPIPTRRWRTDFCWIDDKLAVELEGGTWTGGRHTRGKGFEADCEKYNCLQLAGWIVLRFTDKHLKDGTAIADTKRALGL